MDLSVLYENRDFITIDKPSGLVVHSDGRTKEKTVADWIIEKYPHLREIGEPIKPSNGEIIFRPGIVHRIDRETSGVLLIAKNQEAYRAVKNQFQDRTIVKVYNAFVYGEIQKDTGTINRPIGRSKNDFRKWTAERGARGEMREALTDFLVLKNNKEFSFVEARPKTGRTHQIRVHFKAINHPILCDKLYAPKREGALGFTRLALHALSLEFRLLDGTKQKVEAPLPSDFKKALELLR